jgi:iron complex transport system ATP-binding protein
MHLRLENVDVRYDNMPILKDICLEVSDGEFIGIIGANGSGKTTLIRTIAKALKPTKGVILLNDMEISKIKLRELMKILAVVPQDTQINFDLNIEDVVLMGRTPHLSRFQVETQKDLEIVYDAIKLVRCEHIIGRNIKEVSGGERQKVIIARALAQQPRILLLDEPTSHLDINHQIEIMSLLKKLAEGGLIVIAVVHDLNLASQFCSKILMMKDGRIFAFGEPKDVLTPENIKEVFGIDVIVRKHPITGSYYVLPVKLKDVGARDGIHIICGGGSGSKLMLTLRRVTAGVLNVLDSDWEVANSLGIEIVSEAPFSPITDEAHERNLRMIDKADVVILADVPFGYGNLKNLDAAEYASQHKELIVIDKTPIAERDFTDGKATEIYQRLKARFVKDDDEALELIARLRA